MQKLFPHQWKTLGLVSPASMPDSEALDRAVNFLRKQVQEVITGFDNREKDLLSYLSASPRCRLQHLNTLIRDPRVDALYCTRGGFGSIHLLEEIDFDTLRERNLPLIGYSDITALHMAMLRKKLQSGDAAQPYIQTHIGIGYRMLRQEKNPEEAP